MPPYEFDQPGSTYRQRAYMEQPDMGGGYRGRPEAGRGQFDQRDLYRWDQPGDQRNPYYDARSRMLEDSWARPREVARTNDYRNPRSFDDPYSRLQYADQLMRRGGMEHAERAYRAAIDAADRIDQRQIQQEAMGNWRQMNRLAREASSLERRGDRSGVAETLWRRREQLTARATQLHELYLAPATTRANMGCAYIRTGNPEYVRRGEQLLGEAVRLRPEIELDPNFRRHVDNAYREADTRRDRYPRGSYDRRRDDPRDLYRWDRPRGNDGDPRDLYRWDQPGNQSSQPGSRPGSVRRPSWLPDDLGGSTVPPDGGRNRQPSTDRTPSRTDTGDGRQPGDRSRYAPYVVPPGTTDGSNNGNGSGSDRRNQQPTGADGGDQVPDPQRPSDIPDPAKPNPIPEGKNLEESLAQKLASNALVMLILGALGYKLVKRGREWYLERKNATTGKDGQEGQSEQGKEKEPAKNGGEEKDKPKEPTPEEKERAEREAQARREAFERQSWAVEEGQYGERIVKVGDKSFKLYNLGDGWIYGKHPGNVEIHQAKVHVTAVDAADLARVQKALVPELFDHPALKGKVLGWKTIDPLFTVGKNPEGQVEPTGKGQGAKAFTIYLDPSADPHEVQKIIDRILVEKGVVVAQKIDTGNVDRIAGDSNRVGVVRDLYDAAQTADGRYGAKLDAALVDHIKDKLGVPRDQKLTDPQLRQVEAEARLRSGTLAYDASGQHLMLIGSRQELEKNGQKSAYYMSESGAQKDPAKGLTDRPALYALAEKYLPPGYDPAHLATNKVPPPEAKSGNGTPDAKPEQKEEKKDKPRQQEKREERPESKSEEKPADKPAEKVGESGRTIKDTTGKNQAQLDSEAQALERAVNEHSQTATDPFAKRSFMDAYAARAKDVVLPANQSERPAALTQFLKDYFAGSRDKGGLGSTDPVIQRIQVVASSELSGDSSNGGRVVFKHGGETFTPLYREGNNFVVKNGDGSLRKIPVESTTVEFQIPADKLAKADMSTEGGRWIAREIQSTLYHQLHGLNQLKTRNERASSSGTSIESVAAQDKAVADRTADFVQFELNERRLAPTQERGRVTTSGLNTQKPIDIPGERDVVTRFHPDGRIEVVERGKVRELNEAERDKVVNDAFDELIKEAEKNKDEKRVAELKELKEQYRTNPAERAAIQQGIASNMEGAREALAKGRRGLGTGVGILIVVSAALGLYLASRKSAPHRPPERAPVSGK